MMEQNKECSEGAGSHFHVHRGKRLVGIALIIMFLTFAYSAYIYAKAFSQSIQPSSFRSFDVDGEGKVTAIPDVARFTFGLKTEGGKDIAKIQEENISKMNRIIEFVKLMDVEGKDIKTDSYNLSPKYQHYDCFRSFGSEAKPCPPPEIVGYEINQTVSVKIRDFSKIGDVLSGVVKNGANNVSQLYFELDDLSATTEKARELAIKKAMDKAKKVAKIGGFSVGRLLAIEEGGYQPYPAYRSYIKASVDGGIGGGPEIAPAPSIEAGSQEVTVNITLRYEIR